MNTRERVIRAGIHLLYALQREQTTIRQEQYAAFVEKEKPTRAELLEIQKGAARAMRRPVEA